MSNPIYRRDISIDILKFLAVFLIINSHMDICYPPKYSILATGGAIGDVLFLFASGFTLFMGRMDDFANWYKRRINRIFPSAFVCGMVASLLTWSNSITIEKVWGGQFVIAIMVYYIIIYFIHKYFIKTIPVVLVLVGIISLIVYCVFFPYKFETGEKGLYGITTLYRWIPYFGFMLFGAWLGINRERLRFQPIFDCIMFAISLLLFYGIQFVSKHDASIAPFQIVTLIPLMGIVYYFYKLCNMRWLKKIYANRYGHALIMTVSGLCLESYLIQSCVFTTIFNFLFPLNLPIIIVAVLIVSYCCKVLSRFFAQTFKDMNYDWKDMIKAY